jgi:hypothetical protein
VRFNMNKTASAAALNRLRTTNETIIHTFGLAQIGVVAAVL